MRQGWRISLFEMRHGWRNSTGDNPLFPSFVTGIFQKDLMVGDGLHLLAPGPIDIGGARPVPVDPTCAAEQIPRALHPSPRYARLVADRVVGQDGETGFLVDVLRNGEPNLEGPGVQARVCA